MHEAIRWLVKVAIVIVALPWLGAVACRVFSPAICNAYHNYSAWVSTVIR